MVGEIITNADTLLTGVMALPIAVEDLHHLMLGGVITWHRSVPMPTKVATLAALGQMEHRSPCIIDLWTIQKIFAPLIRLMTRTAKHVRPSTTCSRRRGNLQRMDSITSNPMLDHF